MTGERLELGIRFDMRSPSFGAPIGALYDAAHHMAAWADDQGFRTMLLGEHHATADGYTSTPAVVAASLAARTSRIRVRLRAVLLPLHDPVDVAEQIASLDVLTVGRVEVVFGAGYVPEEYAMFGVDLAARAQLMDEGVRAVVDALTGPSEYRGRPVNVTPACIQQPHPPIYVGGGVPASARRAARLDVGFAPQVANARLVDVYLDECRRLGRAPRPVMQTPEHYAVFVAEDVERAWTELAPHVAHNANSYASMTTAGSINSPFAAEISPGDRAALLSRGGASS